MSKEKLYDRITLGFGQSLIMGHKPESLKLGIMAIDKPDLTIEKFGLFETATPNFHTYYPDVKAEDLKPKSEDFVEPVFRALSEVIVHKNHNPIDFSSNGILKASMSKLIGQTIYANHEAIVGNEIGTVSDVSWQNSYTTSNGIKVPAGINAVFKIDAKSHPNIARAIMMDPPSIHSNSVTVQFGWEQSHPSMDRNEFFGKLATYGSDGQLIRRIATEIVGYHETSLVAHGADPFAQKVAPNGKIVNPEYANSVYSLAATGAEKPKKYFFSYKNDITNLSDDSILINNNQNHNQETEMKDLIKQLSAKHNKPEAEITEQFILDIVANGEKAITDLATEKDNNTKLSSELTEANNKVTDLSGQVENLTSELEKVKPIAEASISKLREETKRVYNLIKNGKADPAKLALIDKASSEELEVELKDYNEQLEKQFPASCNDCGGHNVSRSTSSNGDNPQGKSKNKSDSEIARELRTEAKPGFILAGK